MARADEAMQDLILDSYKDLLLSGNFIYMMKKLNQTETDSNVRMLYGKMAKRAGALVSELSALVKTESVR
jgi:hypothetical protein